MSGRQLKNPPIKEAILTVNFANIISFDKLNELCESEFIQQNYPVKNNLISIEVDKTGTKHKIDGYLLKPKNSINTSIQIKIGQLSFHNTGPYTGWDRFFKDFQNVWINVCRVVGENDLSQIGVRYINQLLFQFPLETQLSEYLLVAPTLPIEINKLNSFFMQLNFPGDNPNVTSVVTQTFNTVPIDFVQIVLDINVMKGKILKCNSENMWSAFDEIRQFKNKLFFNFLSEKTLSKYE